ncbi:MAG: histidine-type phosphatase [Acidobacteriaceae bacterium]
MERNLIKHRLATICVASGLILQGSLAIATAQASRGDSSQLKFALVLTRHGVRSPTGNMYKLNPYSANSWPKWEVPPGYLTPRGSKLMTLFGRYYREYFAQNGLLQRSGCADAASVVYFADSDQRTVATGKALGDGMFPNCSVEVHARPRGTPDPLFHSLAAGVGHPDYALAAAALSGRIGDNPTGLVDAYASTLQKMEEILSECNLPGHCAPPTQSLLQIPSSIGEGHGSHLVTFHGPLTTASTIAEDFLLEYTNGMPLSEVGWGHVDAATVNELITLHTANEDFLHRTPYLAQAQASNLMAHILDTLQQAVEKKKVQGALGNPGDKVVFLVGHDTNIATVAGMLGISWLIDGRRDDTPPGGALVFEVWSSPKSSMDTVRIYYVSQTLQQMRNMVPLTLAMPPARANIFVPTCSTADKNYSCEFSGFQQTVNAAIDPAFVR